MDIEETNVKTSKDIKDIPEDKVATDEEVKDILNNIFNQ